MDRGGWQTAVHVVARVGHDLVTKPPPRMSLVLDQSSQMASSEGRSPLSEDLWWGKHSL